MIQDTLLNIAGQLPFSAFEVISAAVILLFGWYFARVIGWYSANYFGRSKFHTMLNRLKWPWPVPISHTNLPKIVEEVAKWWILLAFVAVSLAIVGFGGASRFFGKVLEDSARILVSLFIFALAALVGDYFSRGGFRFLRRLRNQTILKRIEIFTTWILALLAVAFIAKLVPLKKVFSWGIITLIVAMFVTLAIELGAIGQARKLAQKIAWRFKKTNRPN